MKKEKSSNGLKLLKKYVLKYKKFLILTSITSILFALFSLVSSVFVQILTDVALNNKMQEFKIISLIAIGAILLFSVINYLKNYSGDRLNMLIIKDLQNNATEHIEKLPLSFMEKHHSGDIVSRLNNDMNEISILLTNLTEILYQPVVFIGAFTYLFIISPKLLFSTMILIPISGIIFNKLAKPIQKKAKELMEQTAMVNAMTQDTMNGMQVMKVYQLQDTLYHKYQKQVFKTVQTSMEIQKIRLVLTPIFLILRFIPQLVIPLYGGYLAMKGEISIGGLLGANIIIWSLFLPIESLLNLLQKIRIGIPAVYRVFDILDAPIEKYGGEDLEIVKKNEPICFQDVSFKYEENMVLSHLNFSLPVGKVTALVGPSGSGKTTILKLIYGFYEAQEGTVRVYGNDVKEMSKELLREKLSFVSQEAHLFPATIAENISYGKLNASIDEIVEAAKNANCHEFIMKLSNGYETLIGQGGIKLSGGEKQRISLARAILKNSPILLFDEPTSSLDTHSEALILDALKTIMINKTVLIVAHRLKTIMHASLVIVLSQGQIVETGGHQDLIEQNGLYRKLYQKEISDGVKEEDVNHEN